MISKSYALRVFALVSFIFFGTLSTTFGQCSQLNLLDWEQKGQPANGNWNVASDGSSVLQTINGDPTFFVSPDSIFNQTVQGSFQVKTSFDDDYIGFVFGYQDSLGSNGDTAEMYLFDWKQSDQTFSGEFAPEGFWLGRLSYPLSQSGTPSGYFGRTYSGFDSLATNFGTTLGWADNTSYQFTLTFTSTRIFIKIDNDTIFDVSGNFQTGRFGFYNYSQSQVEYINFTSNICPVAANDSLEVAQRETDTAFVLQNDSDSDPADVLSVESIETPPQNGSASITGGNDGIIYTSNTTYSGEDSLRYVLSDGAGGRDTATLYIKVLPFFEDSVAICDGDSIEIGGQFRNMAGIFADTVARPGDCDSIFRVEVAVLPNLNDTTAPMVICQGDTATLFGNPQTMAGFFTDSAQTVNGCDSITTTELIVNPIDTTMLTATTCDSSMGGISTMILMGSNGCDSVVVTSTMIIPGNPMDTVFAQRNRAQSFVVPAGVTQITVEAAGGKGGRSDLGGSGGAGARLISNLAVIPGQELQIIVGDQGGNGGGFFGGGGGGGGGSFVAVGDSGFSDFTASNILLIAGGGGGGSDIVSSNGYPADSLQNTANGTGGIGGGAKGGGATAENNGGGGTNGGQAAINGADGGDGTIPGSCTQCAGGGFGGFGGGGGVENNLGGGGGGATGGDAGTSSSDGRGHGGTSFSQDSLTTQFFPGDNNSGAGFVKIMYCQPPNQCPSPDSTLVNIQTCDSSVPDTSIMTFTGSDGCDSVVTTIATLVGTQTTMNFSATGSLQSFTVPAGVTQINIEAAGARGGRFEFPGGNVFGGLGAKVKSDFNVIPGQTLQIIVGEEGEFTGGLSNNGGGGGGASFVASGTTGFSDFIPSNILVIAGGGGGAASNNAGDDASVLQPTASGPGGSATGNAGGGGSAQNDGQGVRGGDAAVNGAMGGTGNAGSGQLGGGGFGGGGGGTNGGGGGGGATGGDGGASIFDGGSGGTSFDGGMNGQFSPGSNPAVTSQSLPGDGFVTITFCQPFVTCPNPDTTLIASQTCDSSQVGTSTMTFMGTDGCDSVVITTVSLLPSSNDTTTPVVICDGDTAMIFGNFETKAGTFTDSSTNQFGCDSITTTELIVNPSFNDTTSPVVICQGDSATIFGMSRSVAGIFTDSSQTADGCDSITVTELQVVPQIITKDTLNICEGDSIMVFGNF